MSKAMYLVKRIIELDYKVFFKTVKNISIKTNKNYISVLFDVIYCGIVYQAGYNDYLEFEFYLINKEERKTFLTRGINNEIIKKYNAKDLYYKFDNKIEFNKIFDKYLKRDWIYLEEATNVSFKKFLKSKKAIIVKPIDGEGGTDIEKIDINRNIDSDALYYKLCKNKQYLVEDFIIQHPAMSKLYKNSVNTLRMFTFVKDGKVTFLQGILKVGNGGVVDNFFSGGMYMFVDDNGKVITPAIDKLDNIYSKHPETKAELLGFQVPLFKQAVKLVKQAALEVPEIGYVGWDVAIGENEPLLIEGNCFPGVFQIKPSFTKDKQGILPKYFKVMK